jgi:hypothetical protein
MSQSPLFPALQVQPQQLVAKVPALQAGGKPTARDFQTYAESVVNKLATNNASFGYMDAQEFSPLAQSIATATDQAITAAIAFSLFDKNDSEGITPTEFATTLREMDSDRNGEVTVRELLNYAHQEGYMGPEATPAEAVPETAKPATEPTGG